MAFLKLVVLAIPAKFQYGCSFKVVSIVLALAGGFLYSAIQT
jgi:hypothetical protein